MRIITLITLCCLITSGLKAQIQCDNDSVGLVPLVDLKAGFYLGEYQGGLYPSGKNFPPAGHIKKGLKIAKTIKPLDTLGNVNYETGKIVLAGFGGSTTGEPWNHLIEITNFDATVNPCLKLLNATNSGEGMESMNVDHPDYWDYIENTRIRPKGLTPAQVQIAWLFNGSRADTIFDMPAYRDSIERKVQLALAAMLIEYPNLKLVYVGSPYYAGYADPTYEMYTSIHEPGSYRCGFGFKAAVEKQIMGDPMYKYTAPGKVVPFILWGPYLWTDGNQPRTYDSLFWDCEDDFRVDGGGFHLNGEGKDKLALIIDNFFKTDTLAEIWYNDGPKWASCGDGRLADGSIISPTIIDNDEYQLYPTINNGIFTLELPSSNSLIQITITDNLGRIIYTKNVMETEIQNMQLTNIPSGLYFCNIYYDNMHLVKEFIVNK